MKPKTEMQVRRYAEELKRAGIVEEQIALEISDGLTAGYESAFDEEALARGRSRLAVEMAELNLRRIAETALRSLAWITTEKEVKRRAAALARLLT